MGTVAGAHWSGRQLGGEWLSPWMRPTRQVPSPDPDKLFPIMDAKGYASTGWMTMLTANTTTNPITPERLTKVLWQNLPQPSYA